MLRKTVLYAAVKIINVTNNALSLTKKAKSTPKCFISRCNAFNS